MEESREATRGEPAGRNRTLVSRLTLIACLFVFGAAAGSGEAASIRSGSRRKVKTARTAPPRAQLAPASTPSGPAKDPRSMRAAEGAIVSIIDSYLERRQPSRVSHVYLGKHPVTLYWTADEIDEGLGPKRVALTVVRKDGSRKRIRVSPQFKQRMDVEGTAMLADGRVLNVTSQRGVYDDVTREASLGLGTGGRGLVPFRSIAVNRFTGLKGLKIGDSVFIPQAVGMQLPTGSRHDGYFRVDDVGSGVKGIDIYTMTREDGQLIERVLGNDRRRLPLYKVMAKAPSKRRAPVAIGELD